MNPLTFGTIWKSLIAAVDDGGRVLLRTAFSEALREARDFSVGLFDSQARMIVQGDFSPAHMGSMPSVVRSVLEVYPVEAIGPGDVFVLNDLYLGSGHLSDFFLVSPVFDSDRRTLLGFAVSCAHMVDVGGAVPGSQAVEGIRDHYQEGIRFLPTRFWTAGRESRELIRTLRANVRLPDILVGDLYAMRICNESLGRRLMRVVEVNGNDEFRKVCDRLLDESERAVRDRLRGMADGTGQATDYFDDCGPGTEPIKLCVTINLCGDELVIDFTGSDPETRSGINGIANYVNSYCYFVVRAATIGGYVPQNEGSLRPITIVSPPGTVMNAQPPAGAGARAVMQQRIVDVVFSALSAVAPDRSMAAGSHWANPVFAGPRANGEGRFIHYDVIVGGCGGRPMHDGVEAASNSFNVDAIPIEVMEQSTPLLVETYMLIPDTAGAGQFRGGHAIRKEFRIMADGVAVSNLTDRHCFAPPGVVGGMPGRAGSITVNPAGHSPRSVHSKALVQLERDDIIRYDLAGAGGYGPPHLRDRARVRADVEDGLLSLSAARELYNLETP